jgi:hypothetical protein
VVDGWCSVEELTRLGFARSPVVMANEAHNGMTRCVRTREVGVRMIQAAHQAGVRRLAMEALPSPANDGPEPIRDIPSRDGGYLGQPDMRRLITTALELGWSLWAYEARIKFRKDKARIPMGRHFAATSGIQQFVVDQTVTVDFTRKGPDPWVRDLLAELEGTLAGYGGCAGILREQAPPPLDSAPGVDAVIVSTENELT